MCIIYICVCVCCWESIHFSCPPTKTARRSQQPQQIPFTVLTLSAEAAACRASSGSHTASSTSAKATATWWFSAPTQTTRPSREAPSSGCHCTNLPGRSRKGQSEVERSNTLPGFRGHFAGDGNYELRLEGIVIDISGLRWCDKYKVIVFLRFLGGKWWSVMVKLLVYLSIVVGCRGYVFLATSGILKLRMHLQHTLTN